MTLHKFSTVAEDVLHAASAFAAKGGLAVRPWGIHVLAGVVTRMPQFFCLDAKAVDRIVYLASCAVMDSSTHHDLFFAILDDIATRDPDVSGEITVRHLCMAFMAEKGSAASLLLEMRLLNHCRSVLGMPVEDIDGNTPGNGDGSGSAADAGAALRAPVVKDSGHRREFSTGAVRDMAAGKGRFDLLPWFGVREVALVCEAGAVKYGPRNYEKGIPLSSMLDSAVRHITSVIEGKDDEPHAAQAAWNMLVFCHTRELIARGVLPKHLDDLPKYTPKETA